VQVREIRRDDLDGLADFWRRIGNLEIVGPENWRRRWSGKPLSFVGADPLPVGWVMEADGGRIVGHFGNVPLVYEFRGRTLIAAVASDWDVEKEYRSASLVMMSRYFSQKAVDLFLDTFGTTDALKIFTAMGGKRLPLPDYDRPLFWIVGHAGFVRSAFRKKGWPLGGALGLCGGLALRAADLARRRPATARGLRWRTLPDFDGRFDGFWEALRKTRDKLLLVRRREFLDWYFGDLLRRDRGWIVVCERADRMAGYAVCVRKDSADIGLKRAWVADLQVADDGPEAVIGCLLEGCLAECRARGVHVAEVVGFDDGKRAALKRMGARTRRFPHALFAYKARDKALAALLEDPACWDPCPVDGADAF
jgi:hypothetical protein